MNIQSYTDELDWVLARLAARPGSFLGHILNACLCADPINYELMRPLVATLMAKFPGDATLLAGVRKDRGVS